MFTALATTHFLLCKSWWLRQVCSCRKENKSGPSHVNGQPVSCLIMIMFFLVSEELRAIWKKRSGSWNEGVRDRGCQKVQQTDPAQWFNFLLTSHFLSGLYSSKAQREMWLKLEFPLAGVAEKQENRGRGEREKERERLTALSLHK